MDVIKVGIIGCGVISQTYIRDIRELYQESGGVRLELATCGDVDMEKARECAENTIFRNMACRKLFLKRKIFRSSLTLLLPDSILI